MNSISTAFVIAINTLKRVSKEKVAFLTQVLMPPLAGLIMFTLLLSSTSSKDIKIGAVVLDSGSYGKTLIEQLEKKENYSIKQLKKDDIEEKILSNAVDFGIVIPEKFSKYVERGDNPSVYLYGIEDSDKAMDFKYDVDKYILKVLYSAKNNSSIDNIDEKNIYTEVFDYKKDNSKYTTVFGFFLMFIFQFSTLGVGLILEDKKGKTFMRTFVSPVKNYEVVLGNLIANFFMGLIMVGILMLIAALVYKIDAGFRVFLILLACLITSIGYAIGIAGLISDNKKYQVACGPLSGIMCILGGCFVPLEFMPNVMQKISVVFPTRWAMDGIEKALNGSGISEIYIDIAIILLFGFVLFLFGINVLKPNIRDL